MTTIDDQFGPAGSYALRSGRRAPLGTYLLELNNQAMFMRIAVEDFTAATLIAGNTPRIFAAAQSLLAAAAASSKLLWPPNEKTNPRGPALRAALGSCEHVYQLAPDARVVRNSFEHFDDRLDKYFETGNISIFDQNIAPSKSSFHAVDRDGRVVPHLRFIDNSRWTISVLDEEVVIEDLYDAVTCVGQHAFAVLNGQPVDCTGVRTSVDGN